MDKYLEVAKLIIDTVDSYCNLDTLYEKPEWEEESYYDQLVKQIVWAIEQSEKEGQTDIIKNVIEMLRAQNVDWDDYYTREEIINKLQQ